MHVYLQVYNYNVSTHYLVHQVYSILISIDHNLSYSLKGVASSIWQSIGLLIRRFGVQVPGDPRNILADVAELVDALDLGSSELCSWRFDSSHPHYVLIICLMELLQPILLNLQ